MYGWLFPGEASEYPWDHGVCHGDEMIYLFAFPFPGQDPSTLNDEELELSKKMVKAWTNFVKTGFVASKCRIEIAHFIYLFGRFQQSQWRHRWSPRMAALREGHRPISGYRQGMGGQNRLYRYIHRYT